ncbi:hypothetical protein HMPREF1013_03846 [Bacillus sp. 2_A_57_CT2]|nr:hypothetical protein HMPREF1013_03846 [Bacillus sp. 2_A_57_CT2]
MASYWCTFYFIRRCFIRYNQTDRKKQISELSFFEYVSGITIGSIAGEIIMGLDNHWASGILSILIFGLVTLFADILSLKSKSFRDFFEGKGTIFIKDGKILEDNLKKKDTRLMIYPPCFAKKMSLKQQMWSLLF